MLPRRTLISGPMTATWIAFILYAAVAIALG